MSGSTSSSIGAFDAKTHLSALLDREEAGKAIIITRHGTPVAVLSLVPVFGQRQPGRHKGRLPVDEGFDATLPEAFLVPPQRCAMRLLLDTHILLWWLEDDVRLAEADNARIDTPPIPSASAPPAAMKSR